MCGRFNNTPNRIAFNRLFDIREGIETLSERPRYNIAPSGAPVPVVRRGKQGRELVNLRWPLIPHWAKHGKVKFSTANTKGETVKDKAAFRNAWRPWTPLPDSGDRIL